MSDPFKGWFIVELMGHRRFAAAVVEVQIAGAGFLRCDVPGAPPVTTFVPPSTVYALTPTTEDIARRMAQQSERLAPVSRYELPPGPDERRRDARLEELEEFLAKVAARSTDIALREQALKLAPDTNDAPAGDPEDDDLDPSDVGF